MRWALHLIHVFKYLVSTPNTQHSKSIFKKNAYFTYGRGFIRVTQSVRYFPISLCGICCINWLLQFNESTLSWHSYSFKLKRFFIKWQNWRMRKDFPRFFPAEVYKFLPFWPALFYMHSRSISMQTLERKYTYNRTYGIYLFMLFVFAFAFFSVSLCVQDDDKYLFVLRENIFH